MSLRDVYVMWWFIVWGFLSLMPFIMGLFSIDKNNYETVSDKYRDKLAWSLLWVIFEVVFTIIILIISKILKFI
jgi:hypothetical protein